MVRAGAWHLRARDAALDAPEHEPSRAVTRNILRVIGGPEAGTVHQSPGAALRAAERSFGLPALIPLLFVLAAHRRSWGGQRVGLNGGSPSRALAWRPT